MTTNNPPAAQAGSFRVGDLDLNRIGYGAMQLADPGVFGPPRDRCRCQRAAAAAAGADVGAAAARRRDRDRGRAGRRPDR